MDRPTKIVFATHNAGKAKEVAGLLRDLDIEVITADEAGVSEDVVEDGKSFVENAQKKAAFVGNKLRGMNIWDVWTIGDDSGICVTALNGAPGIYSARWAGENAPGEEWIKLMLAKLQDVLEGHRQAWFETAAVLRAPNGLTWVFNGRIDGTIALEPRSVAHLKLPYDSVFIPEGETRTFAEMSADKKNAISHRGRAFRKLKEFIETELSK